MQETLTKTPRIEVVDALRGFAVMAIILLHNVEHFIFPVYPEQSPAWLAALDEGVFTGAFAIFGGKAYAIFALLFGLTFSIQSGNQRAKGKDFGLRFLWRMAFLVGFATLNAAFFPAGDVLLLFAVVSIVLFITRHWSDKAILITAILFLLQPVEWYHYIASLFDPTHQMPDLGVGTMYAEMAEHVKSGNIGEFFLYNITLGQKASLLWAVGAGRFLQTAGLFLLGTYIGRRQLFQSDAATVSLWTRILIAGALLYCPLSAIHGLLTEAGGIVPQTVGTVFDMWQKLAFTGVLVASFVLLYRSERFRKFVSNLRFYGRMSLTNYIAQSVIGALIYFPIGLYLAPYCGYAVSLLIGFATFALQVAFCRWWLSKHKQGPLEALWHKLTWL